MNTNEFSRAVSPVVGVILVVAITVALSGVVGVFVFDLGQAVSDSGSQSDISTRTTFNDDGTADIQVITGSADEIRVLVNGTEVGNDTNPTPGSTITVPATDNSQITVISESNGESTVVTSSGTSTENTSEPTISGPTDGLIARWSLTDDGTPTTATESQNQSDGVIDSATYVSTTRGTSLQFTSGNEWVNATSHQPALSQTQFTFSVWVHLNETSNNHGVMEVDHDWNFYETGTTGWAYYWHDSNGWAFDIRDGTDSTPTRISYGTSHVNEWVLFTGTYDGNQMCLYANDTQLNCKSASLAYDGNDYSSIGTVHPGGQDSGHYEWSFNGLLQDARLYNRSLSSSEVDDLYNATK